MAAAAGGGPLFFPAREEGSGGGRAGKMPNPPAGRGGRPRSQDGRHAPTPPARLPRPLPTCASPPHGATKRLLRVAGTRQPSRATVGGGGSVCRIGAPSWAEGGGKMARQS